MGNRISIVSRCPFDGKVSYLSHGEAVVYEVLNRIRYGGKRQRPYKCPEGCYHLYTPNKLSGQQKRLRQKQRASLAAWENEGGAVA